jgi:PKD repeat protein
VSAYTWSFGDGQTATGQSVSHSYSAAGSYLVTLTVTDAYGNSGAVSRTIDVATPASLTPGTTAGAGGSGGGKSGTAKTCRPVVSGRAGVKEQVCTTTTVSSIKRLSCKPAGTSGAKRTAEACRTVKLLVTRRRTCTQTRAAGATAWSQRCTPARVVSSRATG